MDFARPSRRAAAAGAPDGHHTSAAPPHRGRPGAQHAPSDHAPREPEPVDPEHGEPNLTAPHVTDNSLRSDDSLRFEPVAVVARYDEPLGDVHPDPSLGWLRRLWPVVGRHWVMVAVALSSSVVAIAAQVAAPAVVRGAIDDALTTRSSPLAPYLWALAFLGLARGVCTFGYRYSLYRIAYLIDFDLRVLLYRHLTSMPFSFFDRSQSGQLISRANSDIRSVQLFLAFAPLMGITLLSFGLALGYMLSIHVWLTLVAVIPLPAVYLVGARLRRQVFPLSWIVQSRMADLATIVDENVNGVRVVRSFAAEERQVTLLARVAQKVRWANLTTAAARARNAPVMENLPRLGMALVLLYGGYLVIDGQLTVGTIVAFNTYILMLQGPFRMLGFFMMMQQRARASADRIFEVLDERSDIADPPDAVDLDPARGEVRFTDVRFGYADGPDLLDGFDLHVSPGETVAIVGRTGSGKSTVARLLPRFYDVRSGSVSVDGIDVRGLRVSGLRHSVGLVLDEPFLFSASVRDNVAYARPDATLDEVVAAASAAQAHGFIEALEDGYDTIVGERGYTLSGGQRQRIAIARSLLADPAVLILDDATSAIDVHVEEQIHVAVRELLRDRTTILIAHRISTISLADRVVLLENGRIVAEGTHVELLATEPRYAEVLAQGGEQDGRAERDEPTGRGMRP